MLTVDACKVAQTDAVVRVVWPSNTRTTASTWIAHTCIVFLCAKTFITAVCRLSLIACCGVYMIYNNNNNNNCNNCKLTETFCNNNYRAMLAQSAVMRQ